MRGASLIERRGWCIGALEDDSGRLCLMGAIRQAAEGEHREVRYRAYDEVNRRLRRVNRDLHAWNDQQTDKAAVVALLRKVARDVDPGVVAQEVCFHGLPVCRACSRGTVCCDRGQHSYTCVLMEKEKRARARRSWATVPAEGVEA